MFSILMAKVSTGGADILADQCGAVVSRNLTNYDGKFTPISCAIGIVLTAISAY